MPFQSGSSGWTDPSLVFLAQPGTIVSPGTRREDVTKTPRSASSAMSRKRLALSWSGSCRRKPAVSDGAGVIHFATPNATETFHSKPLSEKTFQKPRGKIGTRAAGVQGGGSAHRAGSRSAQRAQR